MGQFKIILVGGGVIGLSIAEHLIRKGVACTLIDQGPFAKEASWAGAGYLDLRTAALEKGPFFELCKQSYDHFPEWTERIKQESGLDPELLNSGSLDVAFTEQELAHIQKIEKSLQPFGFTGQWLSPKDSLQKEMGISPHVLSTFYFNATRQVRPPRLTRALIQILQKRKAEFREMEPVEDFIVQGNTVKGVKTSKALVEGDQVVLTSGAWSGTLLKKLGLSLTTSPFRGQVVMYRSQPAMLKHILFTGLQKAYTYMVPRLDGHIYVGSTLEDVGFQKGTTPEGMEKLKTGATRLLPGLSQHLVEESWSGLRPGSQDGLPYLGKVPGWEGLWIATGHFTHGILLSAITGKLMAQLLTQEKTSLDISPFAVGRSPGL
jgi:glycine oxidase